MSDMNLSVAEIRELMAAMQKNRIGSLKLSRNGFSLELEGATAVQVPVPVAAPPDAGTITDAAEPELDGIVVRSPIVGVFYAAPAPDQEPFVKVGSQVKPGDVLFIIESMKLMNEVQSERSGMVSEILVENGQGVEYGQPILRLERG